MFTVGSLLNWLISACALLLTAYVVPGFKVRNFGAALIAALVIGLLNVFVRPFLAFIAFPMTILTMGFFTFVINAVILKMCAYFLEDFDIDSWFSAILGAIVMALLQWILHLYLPY